MSTAIRINRNMALAVGENTVRMDVFHVAEESARAFARNDALTAIDADLSDPRVAAFAWRALDLGMVRRDADGIAEAIGWSDR